MNYQQFIDTKAQKAGDYGFDATFLPKRCKDFQKHLIEWAVKKGRAAIFADCGLGKSVMQFAWAENIVRHTNKRVLILTPIAVGPQMVKEGSLFDVESELSRDGKYKSKIVVTNYERLHYFDPSDFVGVSCDESSCLKDEKSQTSANVIQFMRSMPYRLLCTATAAPNDFDELGTSSEALGELGYQDMLTMFFKKKCSEDHRGWSRQKHYLKGHAENDFWRWVCSWSKAIRKPSDLGYSDDGYNLPPLIVKEHTVKASKLAPGRLFEVAAENLQEQRQEQRRTLTERCEKAAELVNSNKGHSVAWCYLNDESDLLEKLIKDAVQVKGSDSEEYKEETFDAFQKGQIKGLVTKSSIAGFGLNWQHCHHQTFFPSHSFQDYYQSVRRSWRFGQKHEVNVDLVTTDGAGSVLANLNRKMNQADEMFANLVRLMNDSIKIDRTKYGTKPVELPTWL